MTLHCEGQNAQTVPASSMSQGRALKRYEVEVSAPTGQSSMMLPLNGPTYGKPSWVPTKVWSPRSRNTSWLSSATSWEKRTQR